MQGNAIEYTLLDILNMAEEKRYPGHFFWNYAADDGHGDWRQIERGSKYFKTYQKDQVHGHASR